MDDLGYSDEFFDNEPQDTFDYQNATYSQPTSWSPTVAGGGYSDSGSGVDWGDWFTQATQPQVSMSDAIRSAGSPEYSTTPGVADMANPMASVASTMPPTVGQPGPGTQQDDDWKKMLMKGGMGIGASALGAGASALMQSLFQPAQPKPQLAPSSPLPSSPAGQQYQIAPFTPPPGAQWSPLLSGGPSSVQGSQGLDVNARMKKGGSTGGFTLY
jgi:hypothetical protein